MGNGLESKVVFTMGAQLRTLSLPPTGSPCLPQLSALLFPAYKVQTLCGAIGAGAWDGDVELHHAVTSLGMHGNVGAGERFAWLRSYNMLHRGGALCDHERMNTSHIS